MLDTSAYSHFRAGHSGAIDHLAAAATIAVPVVVVGELRAAFIRGTRLEENERALTDFLAEPFVTVLDLTTQRRRHAPLRGRRRKGAFLWKARTASP